MSNISRLQQTDHRSLLSQMHSFYLSPFIFFPFHLFFLTSFIFFFPRRFALQPSSLGSLNSEPLFTQSSSIATTVVEIHPHPPHPSPPVRADLAPAHFSPPPSPPVAFELHIVEDSADPALANLKSTMGSRASASQKFPREVPNGSAAVLTTELESLILTQTVTTSSGPSHQDRFLLKPESDPDFAVSTDGKTPGGGKNHLFTPVASLEPAPAPSSPTSTSTVSVSPVVKTPSLSKPSDLTTPPFRSVSMSETCSVSESISVAAGSPLLPPPSGLESVPVDHSLEDALDNLLAMNFSKPPPELSHVDPLPNPESHAEEVYEDTVMAVDRRDVRPDTQADSEMGDGLLEDQSDCRSDLLDWADIELKLPYDGTDGSMTPMTEASWMDESLTPSSCPGTPDTQMDLPMLHPVGAMDRISASGHVRTESECRGLLLFGEGCVAVLGVPRFGVLACRRCMKNASMILFILDGFTTIVRSLCTRCCQKYSLIRMSRYIHDHSWAKGATGGWGGRNRNKLC